MAKYLFVINSFLAGGAERSLIELLPRLEKRGVAAIVVTLYRREVGFEEEARSAGLDVRLLGRKGLWRKAVRLRRIIRAERPALVYTSLFDADIVGRLACAGLDVPVVNGLVNTGYDRARMADPSVGSRRLNLIRIVDGFTARHLTDHFHAISQAAKDSAVEHLALPAEKITVVRRGRDPDRLGRPSDERTARSRRRLGIMPEAGVIVSVGRQEYQKGHSHLIEAFADLVTDRPATRLLIVGREGHRTEQLNRLIAELGVGDSVTLMGHRSDVPDVLAAADVFVFPSLYEGLGGALIEAMALGLPIVASDLPAIREVVSEGENALLVGPGRSVELLQAMSRLLDDDALRRRFGARSRDLFEMGFDGEAASDRLAELLARVAHRR